MRSPSTQSEREHGIPGRRRVSPWGDLGLELPVSFPGDAVVARAPVVLTGPPLGLDPAAAEHLLERGIEGALVDVEDVAGDLPQSKRQLPPVRGLDGQQLERQHLERAGDDLRGAGEFGHGDGASGGRRAAAPPPAGPFLLATNKATTFRLPRSRFPRKPAGLTGRSALDARIPRANPEGTSRPAASRPDAVGSSRPT